MKVRITYNPKSKAERVAANLIKAECWKVLELMGGAYRVKQSDGNPPYMVTYITATIPAQGKEGGAERG